MSNSASSSPNPKRSACDYEPAFISRSSDNKFTAESNNPLGKKNERIPNTNSIQNSNIPTYSIRKRNTLPDLEFAAHAP